MASGDMYWGVPASACSFVGNNMTCDLGTVPAGEGATIRVTADVLSGVTAISSTRRTWAARRPTLAPGSTATITRR